MLAVGPSSVAQALATGPDNDAAHLQRMATPAREGPVLALVGSLSPVTRAQVEAATGYERLDVDPMRLMDETGYADTVRRNVLRLLPARNVMLVTERPAGQPQQVDRVATATARLLCAIMMEASVSRLIVAGGDTSSHAIAALDVWGLSYRAPLVPGAPICRVHSDNPRLNGIDVILKGGQMGSRDFFREASNLPTGAGFSRRS